MPVELTRATVLLCEGSADQEFFKALCKDRGIPEFDTIKSTEKLSGSDSFDKQLVALEGDQIGLAGVKGILIVADAASDPQAVFNKITRQIRSVPGYPIPKSLSVIEPASATRPAIMISLLPSDSGVGGLESLFVQERYHREPWMQACVDSYLSSGQITASTWSAEKLGKARHHSIVAARHEDDPSRSASSSFRTPATVDISSIVFDPIVVTLQAFYSALGL